jgi:RNA polymerase sigma factor (sigma-70 family)
LQWKLSLIRLILGSKEEGSALKDEECVLAIKDGKAEVYGELVSKYQNMVYRVCLKITEDKNVAEDLAQDAFIRAYDALDSFRLEASFSTWLYQITVRKCLDWKRANARERQHVATGLPIDVNADSGNTPLQSVIRKERALEMQRIVDELSEPYRTVTKLFYFDHCSYQEIAKQVGSSVKTIESQLYRARRILREKGDGLR